MDALTGFPRVAETVREGVERGYHTGLQVCVSVAGTTRLDEAVGEAAPGVALRTDTLMPWLSSCKPLMAVAMAQLMERGVIAYDDPVARHLPAFGQNGKERVTIRQLLLHTGGFRDLAQTTAGGNVAETLEKVLALPLESRWRPGERAGYHPRTSWLVLGALVEAQSGRAYGDWVREEIFLPLGMSDCWMGLPEEVRDTCGDRLGMLRGTDPRQSIQKMIRAADLTVDRARPGSGGIGPVNQLARFYQMLLNGGALDGQRVLDETTVAELTYRQREGLFDETFRHTMDWGLGFMIDSKRYGKKETLPYSFGDHASDTAFGHGGMQSSVGFADPAHGLVVTAVFNGMPGEPRHHRRIRAFCTALYEDLEL